MIKNLNFKLESSQAQVQYNQLTAQESAGKEERTVEDRTTAIGQAGNDPTDRGRKKESHESRTLIQRRPPDEYMIHN